MNKKYIYLRILTIKNMNKHTENRHTEEWLTIKEVMDRLKISRTMLWELSKEGKIPAYKVGSSVRYKLEDVEKVLIPAKAD